MEDRPRARAVLLEKTEPPWCDAWAFYFSSSVSRCQQLLVTDADSHCRANAHRQIGVIRVTTRARSWSALDMSTITASRTRDRRG